MKTTEWLRETRPVDRRCPFYRHAPDLTGGENHVPFRPKRSFNVGDADSGVCLVAAVDGDQVGGESLDLTAVAQAARVDAAHPGDPGGQGLHQVGGGAVVAQHQDIQVHAVHLGIQ
jgi:hypothetical protein